MSSSLTGARMSYVATLVGVLTYGFYLLLVGICLHFLLGSRRKSGLAHPVLTAYTIAMFMTTTTYFISATIWSEQEFVESTVNPGIFASLTSGRLAILKDTAICVNMWLADSLIVYRLFIIWDRNFYIIIFPVMTYIGSIVSGIALCFYSARPGAGFGARGVTDYGTAFWSLSVGLNVIVTILIASRILYHQRRIRLLRQSAHYSGVISILVESASLYSISGLIYIPLFALDLPLQYPFSAFFCATSSIAPNLIVLRMALGVAVTQKHTKSTIPSISISGSGQTPVSLGERSPRSSKTAVSMDSAPFKSFQSLASNGDYENYALETLPKSKPASTDSHV